MLGIVSAPHLSHSSGYEGNPWKWKYSFKSKPYVSHSIIFPIFRLCTADKADNFENSTAKKKSFHQVLFASTSSKLDGSPQQEHQVGSCEHSFMYQSIKYASFDAPQTLQDLDAPVGSLFICRCSLTMFGISWSPLILFQHRWGT